MAGGSDPRARQEEGNGTPVSERNPADLVDGKYGITDLVDLEQLRDLFEKFSEATGFTIGFLDHPGLNVLIATAWRPICTRFHRSTPEAAAVCTRSNRHLLDALERPDQTVVEACEHGLIDCATPIIIKGKHIASLATGQLLLAPPDRERFRAQARRFGFDEDDYLRALDEIPVLSEERVRATTAFLGRMACFISQLGYTRLTQIEERDRAAAAIRESESRLAAIVDQSPISMAIVALDGTIEFFNRKARTTFGFTAQDIPTMEQWWLCAYPDPDYRREVIATWTGLTEKALREQHEIEGREYRVTCKDGSVKTMFIFGVPVAGKVFVMFEDITARKRAEEERIQAIAMLETSLAQSPSGILIADAPDVRIRWANPAALDIRGPSDLPLTGIDVSQHAIRWQIYRPDGTLYKPEELPLSRAILEGEAVTNELLIIRNPDRKDRWILMNGAPVRGKDGNIVSGIAVLHDITAQRRAEAELRQAEKMNAVGQLAGGIAHDFNNQLVGILGYADLLADNLDDPTLLRYAKNITRSAQRAADLTRQLLAFSRKGKFLSIPVDLHKVIGETVELLSRSIDKRITIRQHLAAATAIVQGDPTQMQNALLNLGLNARDAMPEGGELTFATCVMTFDKATSGEELMPGSYLQISVSDTGIGMSPEVQSRLFEPFFTTKGVGKGTGLGLPSVFGAVKSHGGAIQVSSELGHGSVFRLSLPLLSQSMVETASSIQALSSELSHRRILIVDDEPMVLEIAGDMLRPLGCETITCSDPFQALELYRKIWRSFDLVILDMVMPKMGGRELFLAMRAINPALRAILCSGLSLDGEAQDILRLGVLAFAQKPFQQEELARILSEALTRSS